MLLLAHAATAATRRAAFAEPGEPVDHRGLVDASLLAAAMPAVPRWRAVCGPEARCLQTAEGLGLGQPAVELSLREWDAGRWVGRRFADVAAQDAADARAWTSDPGWDGHGGESLLALLRRVGAWLDAAGRAGGHTVAVTSPAVVRAAVVHVLACPPQAFWAVDVAPLAGARLHHRAARWTVALGPAAG